jgi:hypothetical protein
MVEIKVPTKFPLVSVGYHLFSKKVPSMGLHPQQGMSSSNHRNNKHSNPATQGHTDMDSQEFAQEYPWITWAKAYKIAKEHGLETELACEAHDEVKTRGTIGAIEVNTQSLLLWLGY